MGLFDLFDNSLELLTLCLIYGILMVDTRNRYIGRDLDDIHTVGIAEFLLLGKGCTGHAGLLVKLVEEVLEGDRRKCLGFTFYPDMLLGLNSLMETVTVAAARHDTSCELIYYKDLFVLDHVVLILEHKVIGTQRKDDTMLDLQVLRIGQVVKVEELLYLGDTLLRKVNYLFLFIHYEIAGLDDIFIHDGIHLGKFAAGLTPDELLGNYITELVELGALA